VHGLMVFCQWLEHTHIATTIRESLWLYPFIQLIHFSGLSLWIATIAIVDLHFLGVLGRHHPGGQFAQQLLPWPG
jgi:hypothetical protein